MSKETKETKDSSLGTTKDSSENPTLEAYNFADSIQQAWKSMAVPKFDPIEIQWLKSETKETDEINDTISEGESIGEQIETKEKDKEEEKDKEDKEDDEDEEDNPPEDLEDFYMWPKRMDNIVFQLSNEIEITRYLMNKVERKVYFGFRKTDRLPVVVIVGEDYEPELAVHGVPREVQIMMRLRHQPNVAEILGWAKATDSKPNYFVLVLRHYQNTDIIQSSDENLYIVSKMMKSAITALKQVHDNGVCHRDVAKHNFLWDPMQEKMIIIDFDNSCFYRKQGYYKDVGRERYDAPEKTEMLEIRRKLKEKYEKNGKVTVKKRMKAYTEKADIYSLGVLFWMMLTHSYHSPHPRKLKKWVAEIKRRNQHKRYPELDLLTRMLVFDPNRRITLEEALEHPFIVETKPDKLYTKMREFLLNDVDTGSEESKKSKKSNEVDASSDSDNSDNSDDSDDSDKSDDDSDDSEKSEKSDDSSDSSDAEDSQKSEDSENSDTDQNENDPSITTDITVESIMEKKE